MTYKSPDAKDLYESSSQFATEPSAKAVSEFVTLVADIIKPLRDQPTKVDLSSVQIARMLSSAMPGFKSAAKTTGQLRELIAALITVVIASLEKPKAVASCKEPLKKGKL